MTSTPMMTNPDFKKLFAELVDNTNLSNGYLTPVLEKLDQPNPTVDGTDIAQIAKSVDHLIISNARIQELLMILASGINASVSDDDK